jgi:hypothetical protein
MKKISYLLILISSTTLAQNESIYISIGKPWYPDKANNLNNYSLGLNYQNKFSQSFAFEFNFEYVQSDDFPNFYRNSLALNEFLLNQTFDNILINSQWSKISNINIGTRLNYLFVNNKNFNFNFSTGLGFMFTKSSSHYLKNWNYLPITGQIISYENETISDSLNTFYYTLGLQFQYTFYKEYFIGINPYYLMPIGEKKINTIPVYPNYYNLTLNIGKKF